MPNKKRKLDVILCTDPMSSVVFDHNQEKEYAAIEVELQELLDDFELHLQRNILPYKLANTCFDIYLFDFGGMMPGCEDAIASHYNELIRQADDHPSSVFVLYSTFSVRWYKECMEEESRELSSQLNVVLYDYDDVWVEFIKTWFTES